MTELIKVKDNKNDDKQLRANITLLKSMFNSILVAEANPRIAGIVDKLQHQFIMLEQHGGSSKRQKLIDVLHDLPVDTQSEVIRAFSLYFSLLNIAEESANLSQRRRQIEKNKHYWRGSFHDTLLGFKKSGVGVADLQILLKDLCYMPVITAHPTEAKRRTVRGALRNVFLSHKKLNDIPGQGFFHQQALERLQAQIQMLWKTDEVRARNMNVVDEIDSGLFYFPLSLFESTAQVYRNFHRALQDVYGVDAAQKTIIPSFLCFGSWIGGDRDGNPNVKPETTVLALRLQSRTILQEYIRRVDILREQLSYSYGLCEPTAAFLESLKNDHQLLDDYVIELESSCQQEPYRHKLSFIQFRLKQVLLGVEQRIKGLGKVVGKPLLYSGAQLSDDLKFIHQSLVSHGDRAIADLELQDLIRLVDTFGFHLMQLDVRQESTHHTAAVAEIFSVSLSLDYYSLNEQQRMELLGETISTPGGLIYDTSQLSESSNQILAVFQVMADMLREIGDKCFSKYVISMTHEASHVLEVALLATQCGLAGRIGGQWYCHIGISPLFETIDDLNKIDNVLRQLFGHPEYRALLKASGESQEVMLGYSDSCKDGGIMASAWGLYQAQLQVMQIADNEGIPCRMFHGRGGTIGRGGGPTHEAIMAQPPATVRGQIKFTEQGEVLFYRYNNLETAVYELTMGITGLLKASLSLVQSTTEESINDLVVMNELVQIGENKYRQLTEHTPAFLDYFYEATPIADISRLNIGSRPSHRKKQDRSKQSVRAIGWVFSWAQSRQTFPAWYGIGSSLQYWCAGKPERLDVLRKLYRDNAFFHNLLSNAQMALSKSNMNIAREYATLCIDKDVGRKIHRMIESEYYLCVDWILEIAETGQLLAENPQLAASLQRRNDFLGPLNYIQAGLLRAVRDDNKSDAGVSQWMKPLLSSMNAIAAGMRNTG